MHFISFLSWKLILWNRTHIWYVYVFLLLQYHIGIVCLSLTCILYQQSWLKEMSICLTIISWIKPYVINTILYSGLFIFNLIFKCVCFELKYMNVYFKKLTCSLCEEVKIKYILTLNVFLELKPLEIFTQKQTKNPEHLYTDLTKNIAWNMNKD